MWVDIVILGLIAREIYLGTVCGVRGSLLRAGLLAGAGATALILMYNMRRCLAPVLQPSIGKVIQKRLAVSVGGVAKAIEITGPWRPLLALPADSHEKVIVNLTGLTISVAGYIVAAVGIWAVLTVFMVPRRARPQWWGGMIGLGTGMVLILALLLCLPVLALIDQGELLAAGLSESMIYAGLMPVLTSLVKLIGYFFVGG